jgi:hypothetical protein
VVIVKPDECFPLDLRSFLCGDDRNRKAFRMLLGEDLEEAVAAVAVGELDRLVGDRPVAVLGGVLFHHGRDLIRPHHVSGPAFPIGGIQECPEGGFRRKVGQVDRVRGRRVRGGGVRHRWGFRGGGARCGRRFRLGRCVLWRARVSRHLGAWSLDDLGRLGLGGSDEIADQTENHRRDQQTGDQWNARPAVFWRGNALRRGGDGLLRGGDGFLRGGDGFLRGGDGFLRDGDALLGRRRFRRRGRCRGREAGGQLVRRIRADDFVPALRARALHPGGCSRDGQGGVACRAVEAEFGWN